MRKNKMSYREIVNTERRFNIVMVCLTIIAIVHIISHQQ